MKVEDGWKAILDLLKTHYMKDDNFAAFETENNFGICQGKKDQTIDQYIMHYKKRYKIDVGERIHGLNLLCGAVCQLMNCVLLCVKLMGTHQIPCAIRPKSLKKYSGCSGIAYSAVVPTSVAQLITPKQEPMYAGADEYETFVAW